MALGLDEFKEELPQIAKVLAIDDDSITLEWWVGTYTGTWAPWIIKSNDICAQKQYCTKKRIFI